MKPPRLAFSPRMAAPAVLLLALAAAGCTAPQGARSGPYNFNITFKADPANAACPDTVVVAEVASQCDAPGIFSNKKVPDCLNAKKGEYVTFTAVASSGTPPKKDLKFKVCFDPFGEACIEATNGEVGRAIPLKMPAKTYVFNVFSEKCDIKDPQIIIMP
jgi:hypothetical protein